MRHLLGLLLAVIMVAALFFAATWGFTQLTARHAAALTSPTGLAALGAMAGTGLLLGLLLCTPRVSPLASGLPGLLLLGWTGALVGSSRLGLRYIPLKGDRFGSGFELLLTSGVLALLGMAMIVPLFVPSRWRRHGYEEDEGVDDDLSLPAATGLLS
jgi:hypothetical protein